MLRETPMMTKEEALEKIRLLIQRFEEQKEFYKNSDYNETQTRRDFVDPFWKALSWDMDNTSGYAESYREVLHEDRIDALVNAVYGLTEEEVQFIESEQRWNAYF